MRSSMTSAYSEPNAYQTAMRMEGVVDFTVTRNGRFQARLTQVGLECLRVFAVKESIPRIAFIKIPQDQILISTSLSGGSSQHWGGARAQAENLITLGPGARVHTRTEGPSHWGAVWFPIKDFARYSQALTGKTLVIPDFVCLWRPPGPASRLFRHILTDVMRAAQMLPDVLTATEAAHGLDQQLIHALIECLSSPPMNGDIPMRRRRQALMIRFEKLVAADLSGYTRIATISKALGVSDRFLRRCCDEQLGMNPLSYLKLRRLHEAHGTLKYANPEALSVSEAARRSGFRHLGRFAADYRDLFGETPSVTLRQKPDQAMPELAQSTRKRRLTLQAPVEIDQCGA